jgi:hypothetical protein
LNLSEFQFGLANAVVELVRDMPGLDGLEGGFEVDQAILAAADYNCK